MATRKSKGSLSWYSIASLTGIIVAGIGTAVFLWNQSKTHDDHNGSCGKSKGPSKIIIVTNSISLQEDIDWNQMLQENVVLLIKPGVPFLTNIIDDRTSTHQFKIIRCDTMIGLWSCVKHLQKEQLLYIQDEIADEIPHDLTRYVKELIKFKDPEQLKNFCE